MKKKKKYLELYKKWLKEGRLPERGLCFSLPIHVGFLKAAEYIAIPTDDPLFELFKPWTEEEYPMLKSDPLWQTFWLADGETNGRHLHYKFTPLRQTILLFMAAMNNEL